MFRNRILIPPIRSNNKSPPDGAIRGPPEQQKEESDWARRMARGINVGAGIIEDLWKSDGSGADPFGNRYCVGDNVYREAHAYILAPDPSARDVYAVNPTKMPMTPAISGVKVRRDARDGRLARAEIPDNAIQA